jgi:hypothetical protein
MDAWKAYPLDYRAQEIEGILQAICAGQCAAVIGLSGAGKSNLMGFLANRAAVDTTCPLLVLMDCNRLGEVTRSAFLSLLLSSMNKKTGKQLQLESLTADAWASLEEALECCLEDVQGICFLIDRFDRIVNNPEVLSTLRALRDLFKYRLSFVIAARRLLDVDSEAAELFFGRVISLGVLKENDALWSIQQFAARADLTWEHQLSEQIIHFSWGYPSLLRAVCEAAASGCEMQLHSLRAHPAVKLRVREFWADAPSMEEIRKASLVGQPLLGEEPPLISAVSQDSIKTDLLNLTLKEKYLLDYFLDHAGVICEKDELIRAVWPEDKIYSTGIRDDSLAQLIRRLRKKIEVDASSPHLIMTIPGRGYRFILQTKGQP